MKRFINCIIALCCVCCVLFFLCSCNKEKPIAIDLAEVVAANKADVLLRNYDSFEMVLRSDGEEVYRMYVDETITYYCDTSGYQELFGDDFEFFFDEGQYYGTVLCGYDFSLWDVYQSLSDETAKEPILSSTTNKKEITLVTAASDEDLHTLLDEYDLPYQDGDTMTCTYLLDAKTLALLRLEEVLIHKDGSQKCIELIEFTYNTPLPDEAEAMLLRSKPENDLRTLTIVLDPNTKAEQSFFKTVRKGDQFGFILPEGYTLYTDEACTIPFDFSAPSDPDAHMLLFAKE